MLGLLYVEWFGLVEWNAAGSNLAVLFNFVSNFSKFWQFVLIYVVTCIYACFIKFTLWHSATQTEAIMILFHLKINYNIVIIS